jgi:hypothetical protein
LACSSQARLKIIEIKYVEAFNQNEQQQDAKKVRLKYRPNERKRFGRNY